MKTKADFQAENDRLRAALAAILDVCARERHDLADWPRAVGEIEEMARAALEVAQLDARLRMPARGGER